MKVTNDIGIGIDDGSYRKKAGFAAPFHSEVLEVAGDFEVLDRSPPIRHENKNIDAATMAKAIRVTDFSTARGDDVAGSISFGADRDNRWQRAPAPANVAFRAFARVGGKERACGYVTATAGTYGLRSYLGFALEPDERVDKFDLILRSSDEEARETADLYEIWGGEVVIPNVKVER